MGRTVTDPTEYVPNSEMSAFGYLMTALLVIVVLPLVPFIAAAWLLWRIVGAGGEPGGVTGPDRSRRTGRPPSGV